MQLKDMYWIFYDRVWKAADNAEFLYRWVRINHPEIKIAYILNSDNREEQIRLTKDHFNLIDAKNVTETNNELKKCTHALSSIFTEGTNLSFDGCTCKRIFLNHGCFILPMVHIKDQADQIDLFIAGSKIEYDNFLNPYHGLIKEQVALCGLPRHDYLVNNQKQLHSENNILIQFWLRPKWDETKLLKSDFYKNVCKLLTDARLKALAAKYKVKFVFKLHSSNDPKNWEAKCNWLDYLPKATPWLRYSPSDELYEDLFVSSKLIITDFSSNGSEMAKINKPVLYYWPDPDYALPWRLRRNGGQEFDFVHKGIGPVTKSLDKFFAELTYLLDHNCIAKKLYLTRQAEQISFINDANCCKRCFDAILQVAESRTMAKTLAAKKKKQREEQMEKQAANYFGVPVSKPHISKRQADPDLDEADDVFIAPRPVSAKVTPKKNESKKLKKVIAHGHKPVIIGVGSDIFIDNDEDYFVGN